ncbi:hypothetical protein EVAR_16793_1 [Eumeta japonica]|uniref:Uncharacterized protein n=1 Tax=Eumeta variegata TaxID=151549 RepID=A0A4C1UMB6_EUMVA|nr:hypothetical protein EVAR_16793_1 [Eumeta japonica]
MANEAELTSFPRLMPKLRCQPRPGYKKKLKTHTTSFFGAAPIALRYSRVSNISRGFDEKRQVTAAARRGTGERDDPSSATPGAGGKKKTLKRKPENDSFAILMPANLAKFKLVMAS